MKQIIMDTVNSIAKPESSLLASVSDLLVAGLRSRHEAIVNDFIILWNQTFAKAEALEYPAALHHVLRKIRSRVDIELPGFVDNEETEVHRSLSYIQSWTHGRCADYIVDHVFAFQLRRISR